MRQSERGSEVEVAVAPSNNAETRKVKFTVEETGHFQKFVRRSIEVSKVQKRRALHGVGQAAQKAADGDSGHGPARSAIGAGEMTRASSRGEPVTFR